MSRRFAFAYFMKDRASRIREIAPYHIEYWREITHARCVAGPFADRSGGLVTFEASSLEEAAALVAQDPFSVHTLLAHWWVKEWAAEPRRLPCRHRFDECPSEMPWSAARR
jgi:uncharacterized protein YciI